MKCSKGKDSFLSCLFACGFIVFIPNVFKDFQSPLLVLPQPFLTALGLLPSNLKFSIHENTSKQRQQDLNHNPPPTHDTHHRMAPSFPFKSFHNHHHHPEPPTWDIEYVIGLWRQEKIPFSIKIWLCRVSSPRRGPSRVLWGAHVAY